MEISLCEFKKDIINYFVDKYPYCMCFLKHILFSYTMRELFPKDVNMNEFREYIKSYYEKDLDKTTIRHILEYLDTKYTTYR